MAVNKRSHIYCWRFVISGLGVLRTSGSNQIWGGLCWRLRSEGEELLVMFVFYFKCWSPCSCQVVLHGQRRKRVGILLPTWRGLFLSNLYPPIGPFSDSSGFDVLFRFWTQLILSTARTVLGNVELKGRNTGGNDVDCFAWWMPVSTFSKHMYF